MSIRITDLPPATPLQDADITVVVQGGVTKYAGMTLFYNYASAQNAASLLAHTTNYSNPHSVTKTQVGLSNVDNTSDVNKPVSTLQASADAAVSNELKSLLWMGI